MSIKAIFPEGVTALTVNGLHQWDYGQTLEIEAPDLPLLVEVHFACAGMKEAVVRLCQLTDGKISAAVPDTCLEQRSPVVAWVYELDEAGGKTVLTVTMPVIARIKPPASSSSPTVADQYAQLITLFNDQMDGIFSGAAPVGRAFEADHVAEASRATEADHAESAREADHAESARALDDVLPVAGGGTGLTQVPADHLLVGDGTGGMKTRHINDLFTSTGACAVVEGTIAGTGTNKVSLVVGFVPTLVMIWAEGNYGTETDYIGPGEDHYAFLFSDGTVDHLAYPTDYAFLDFIGAAVDGDSLVLDVRTYGRMYPASGYTSTGYAYDDRWVTYRYKVMG